MFEKMKNDSDLGSPLIEDPEIHEVVATLKSGWLGTGSKVAKFEDAFKEYAGVNYAMALNSCTAGLYLAMVVSGVRQGDEVITTPLTFCSTANAIIHTGVTPVFVDVEKESMNIDPKEIEESVTPRTRAIIQSAFTMIEFTLFFGHLVKISLERIPYPIFIYVGLLSWTNLSNPGDWALIGISVTIILLLSSTCVCYFISMDKIFVDVV